MTAPHDEHATTIREAVDDVRRYLDEERIPLVDHALEKLAPILAATDALEAALAAARTDNERLLDILDRVIDEGVEKWHTAVNDEPHLPSWLGLTDREYAAWVEQGPRALADLPRGSEK